jgi:hypothetical protein
VQFCSSPAPRSDLDLLDNLEIDAGITYLGNEPLGRVSATPLYHERYRRCLADRWAIARCTWAEVAQGPLCCSPDVRTAASSMSGLSGRRRRVSARRSRSVR